MTDLTLLPQKNTKRDSPSVALPQETTQVVKCSETFYARSKAADYDCFSAVA